MAKTIQIPSSLDRDPQIDEVRTSCCLFVDFAKSGYFQSPLAVDFFGFKESRVHVNQGMNGPFKTPRKPTSIPWHFDSDDNSTHRDGKIEIDYGFPCNEYVADDRCTDDDAVEETMQ